MKRLNTIGGWYCDADCEECYGSGSVFEFEDEVHCDCMEDISNDEIVAYHRNRKLKKYCEKDR